MRKKIFLFLISFFFYQFSFSQKQTNFWYFGTLAGLDFNNGSPVALTNGTTTTNEGTAVMSDNSGNLLFYTDGIQVWNKNNVQMPNGDSLMGDISTTQTLIVPDPGNASLFYIFTLDDEGGPDGLNYSVVDMTLQFGNGDVTVKNTHLRNTMTEKLAGVYHCNNHDIWVMTHDQFTNTFAAYLVTDNGINSAVISNVGITHTDVHGQMKFSSDGNKLACAAGYQDTVEVFDFDKTTGIVSNPLTLPINHHVYGIEFSPDNSKLYGTYYDLGSTSVLYQFDLNAGNVQASQLTLGSSPDPVIYAVQLGPENKIYVTKEITPFLSVIDNPNVAGTGCNYVDNAINLDPSGMGTMCMLGLPGFIQSYFNPNFPNVPCSVVNANFSSSDSLCKGECINFTDMSTGAVTSWTWTFNGAIPSSSTAKNPTNICYNSDGNYDARLIVSDGTTTDTIQKAITVKACELPCGDVFVPTAFSPNNDNENDVECMLGGCIEALHFAIYDRWGEKVFETSDQNICWDGTYKGKLMNTASFVYYLKATLVNGEEISKKGNISLIR